MLFFGLKLLSMLFNLFIQDLNRVIKPQHTQPVLDNGRPDHVSNKYSIIIIEHLLKCIYLTVHQSSCRFTLIDMIINRHIKFDMIINRHIKFDMLKT